MCSRCQNNVDWIQFFLFQINSSKKNKQKKKQEQRQFGLFDNIILVFIL